MNVYYATRSTSNVAPCRRRKRKSACGLSLGQAGPGANVWGNTINGRGRHCHVCARPSISLCSACWGLAAARAVRCAALRVAPAGTRRRAGASRAAALIVARPTQDAPLLGPLLLATHFPDSNVITSTSRASNVITRCLGFIMGFGCQSGQFHSFHRSFMATATAAEPDGGGVRGGTVK